MDKFISIGVNQGDAFYLERGDKKILVDGGRSTLGFSLQFERTTGTKEVDVIVCTHADADHINGLIGFFNSGLNSKELWLPGKWSSRLQDILENPIDFGLEILSNIKETDIPDGITLESVCESKKIETHNQEHKTNDNTTIKQLNESIEKASGCYYLTEIIIKCIHRYPYLVHDKVKFNLLVDAIKTTEKIRNLAIAAYHSGTKIRWYEYGESPTINDGESYLLPVNSSEIFRTSKYMSALLYLSVSKSNKHSLVFYSPSTDKISDVLFCGDSDLSFLEMIPAIGATSIITSPHHGSEYNKNAYIRLEMEESLTEKTILVRSDGRFEKRPGETYRNIKSRKICTICRHPNAEKQDVEFTSSNNGWKKENNLHWCYCI